MSSIVTFRRRLKIDKPLMYTPLTACPVGRLIFGEFFLLQPLLLVRHCGVAGITCVIVTPALRRQKYGGMRLSERLVSKQYIGVVI